MNDIKLGGLGLFKIKEKETDTYQNKVVIEWKCDALDITVIGEISKYDIETTILNIKGNVIKLNTFNTETLMKLMKDFDPKFKYTGVESVIKYVYYRYFYEEKWF